MGLFCVNLHLRSIDDTALAAALARRKVKHYRIAPAQGEWTSLYEERLSTQDDGWVRKLGTQLTRDLGSAAIAFLVHDSDIACYWLFENGKLLDEFNSCPDYFDDGPGDGSSHPSGGDVDVLLRFCRPGVTGEDLTAILRDNALFAESLIERLAAALGIDPQRALADFGHAAEDGPDEDDDEGGDDDGPGPRLPTAGLLDRVTGMLGLSRHTDAVDPQAQALVNAAVAGDVAEIDRLLAAGVAVDAEAPAPLVGPASGAGMGQVFANMKSAPGMPMTPLLAAIVHKRPAAVERLLHAGADVNRSHMLLGTAVHVATSAGEPSLLRLILDRGGDPKAVNIRGQTPLQIIAASRATKDRLAQMQTMMKSMGASIPGLAEQMSKLVLPTEGWDACEKLLRASE